MNNWEKLKGKKVRLLIEDNNFPKPRDGIINDVDETHIWLEIERIITRGQKKGELVKEVKPFSRRSVKRIDEIYD